MATPAPEWLQILSWTCVIVAIVCAGIITIDELRTPQHMMIMNLVWPITALYWGPIALWAYFVRGRRMAEQHPQKTKMMQHLKKGGDESNRTEPTPAQIALATSHCGGGCTIGDVISEWAVWAAALSFAGGLVFPTRLLMDFILAWALGIAFQYFTIVPMRGLSPGRGLLEAMRADTLSIVAFEIGLFGWMALTYYILFSSPHLKPTEATFWFMMQVGMIIGFFTSYPANQLLLNLGWKKKMG